VGHTVNEADAGSARPSHWWDANAGRLFLCGFAVLFWELVLIRWLGATIRIVAYFSNLVLISAFFGLGVGALATRFPVRLERLIAPLIAFVVMLGVWLGGLWHANPKGGDEYIWIGAPLGIASPGAEASRIVSAGVVLVVVYGGAAALFAAFGQYLGRLFRTQPPLRAYSIEVGGSLLGIVLFALMSYWQTPPTAWFAVGVLLLVLMLPRPLPDGALAALLGVLVVIATHAESQRHVWSPYYRISVEPLTRILDPRARNVVAFGETVGNVLTVNNDYHQMMLDLRPRDQEHVFLSAWRGFYDAPYFDYAGMGRLPPGRILVVGAGTGNDVAAALRRTDRPVTAVEIDPAIAELGRRLHAESPYADPRVTLVIDDARSFFNGAPSGEYALVVFGFLDSHRLLSAFSSVRLDNFIYTQEAMVEVRRLLVPGGRVALSFATNEVWIHERILALLDRTFGRPTRFTKDAWGYANGVLYLNERSAPDPATPRRRSLVPTDDWPFLYLRERAIPGHNAFFLLMAVALSVTALLILPRGERRLRLPYFFLGAAFFLLETSNVVRMALLYGSTWWVNTVVFAGILALVLLANLTASRWRLPLGACLSLLAALILTATVLPSDALFGLSPFTRAIVAVVVFLGPVYFGGLIFARLIENETRLYEAYGSNVLGAVLGGTAEYLSLVFGFRFLLAVALAFYLVVFLLLRGAGAGGGRAPLSST
jgi:SAM-dependent methyltransferase